MTARKASAAKSKMPRRNLNFRSQEPASAREERRRELWILGAIAVLFVLNAAVYLCHHWNFTSSRNAVTQPPLAPRVYAD